MLSRASFRRGEVKKERLAVRFVALVVGCTQCFHSSRDAMRLLQADPGAGRFLDGAQLQLRTEARGAKPPPAAGGAGGGNRNRRGGTWAEFSPCETLDVYTEA